MPEIVIKHIQKVFGNKFTAVSDLNMEIEDRAFITLLGPSGCGKTTTLRMIAGLETPTKGEIMIDGVTVFDSARGINLPPDKRNVGFLFQNYALWPHMTVYKNIAFGLENLKWKKEDIKSRVNELMDMLKIHSYADRYPSELSGGQQQRVAIARTLAPKPRVLFMDEPLSNLDAKLRAEMRTELKRLHADTNSTFIYVTHDQLEAMTLSTSVCLMEAGMLKQLAPPLEIYNRPGNLFVADFMGNPTMNFIEAEVTASGEKECLLKFHGIQVRFLSEEPMEINGRSVVLGIRPEHIEVEDDWEGREVPSDKKVPAGEIAAMAENGTIKTNVYATLPTGMETTVRIMLGGELLSAVIFGSVDYPLDHPIRIRFTGTNILLFDKASTNRIGNGRLESGGSSRSRS